MIEIKFLKPFYVKATEEKLRLVFAHQYLSIVKDEEVYQFVPIAGKEIVVNLETCQPENLSDVFVFQRGDRYIRMPLYQFFLVSNAMELIRHYIGNETEVEEPYEPVSERELKEIIFYPLIDRALEIGDKPMFMALTEQLKGSEQIGTT